MAERAAVEQMAAEEGPRWRSRKEAWLDGYRHGEMQARMTGGEDPFGPVEDAAYIRGAIERGKSPEAEAIQLLRKFMCCKAGRDWVIVGLLQPFAHALTADTPTHPPEQEGGKG